MLLDGTEFVEDAYAVARGADTLLLLTEWKEYRELDWKRMNMLAPAKMKELDFEYYSFGCPDLNTNAVLVPAEMFT